MQTFTNLFPVWVILAGVFGLIYPPALTWVGGDLITILLGVIMLGMGLALTFDDFKRVLRVPWQILPGVVLQYTVMPALGFSLAWLLQLPRDFAVGLILVCCCPGGTASNVISFLARLNLELSVSMTAISTILAIAMTPLLTTMLVGDRMEVDAAGLFIDTFIVVLLPVTLGLLLNRYFNVFARRIQPIAPPIAVIAIALIVGSILGKRRADLLESGHLLLLAVVTVHTMGFLLGYFLSRLFVPRQSARTISVEVGMQNSGLGAKLAESNFSAHPLVALPSAISALTHCILGSICVAMWRRDSAATMDASE